MIAPINALNFSEALRIGSEVYHHLKSLTKNKYRKYAGNVGVEGSVAPHFKTSNKVFDLIVASIEKAD